MITPTQWWVHPSFCGLRGAISSAMGSTNALPAGPLLKHGLRAQTRRKGKAIKVRRIDLMAGGRRAIEMRLRPANPKWIQHHLRLFGSSAAFMKSSHMVYCGDIRA
jgi:hypothetical protein